MNSNQSVMVAALFNSLKTKDNMRAPLDDHRDLRVR